jgi:hypothetical protein
MKVRAIAVVVAIAMTGSLLATAAAASGDSKAQSDNFNLRTTTSCVAKGSPTTCTIDVTKLRRSGNQIVAHGTVTPADGRSLQFTSPIVGSEPSLATVGTVGRSVIKQQTPAPSCDILNLVLGPLHLNVLGLVVDLNQVLLNITGQTGAGNLLGNLLCGLFGLLDGVAVISQFLAVISNLLNAINSILAL